MFWIPVIESDDYERFLEMLYLAPDRLDTKLLEDSYGRTIGTYLFSPTANYRKNIHTSLAVTTDPELYEQILFYIHKYINCIYKISEDSSIDPINYQLLHFVLSYKVQDEPLYQYLMESRLLQSPNILLMKACLNFIPSRIDRETHLIVKFNELSSKNYWVSFFPHFLHSLLEQSSINVSRQMIRQMILCLDYGLRIDVDLPSVLDDTLLFTNGRSLADRLTMRMSQDSDDPQNALDIFYHLQLCLNVIHQFKSWTNISAVFNIILRYATSKPRINLDSIHKKLVMRIRHTGELALWFKCYQEIQELSGRSLMTSTRLLRVIVGHDFHGLLRLYKNKYPFKESQNINSLLVTAKNRIILSDGSFASIRYLYDLGADISTKDDDSKTVFSLLLRRSHFSGLVSNILINDLDKYRIDAKSFILDILSTESDSYFHYLVPDIRHYCKFFF